MTIAPCSCATRATSTGSGASTNPVWAKFDGWTRRTMTVARPSASGASKSAARVRFVVPTSTSRAPARRTISGMRTPPPISTSSPARDRHAPCWPASPTASARAAALLIVTSASSAPVSAIEMALRRPKARPATPGCRDRTRAANSRPRHAWAAAIASAGHGARPRLVWRMTPVALRTVTRPLPAGSMKAASRARTSSARRSIVAVGFAGREPGPFVGHDLAGDRGQRIRIGLGRDVRAGRREQPSPRSGDADDPTTWCLRGGNAWESNPPRRAERRATGFEDQGTHRDPTAPVAMVAVSSVA